MTVSLIRLSQMVIWPSMIKRVIQNMVKNINGLNQELQVDQGMNKGIWKRIRRRNRYHG